MILFNTHNPIVDIIKIGLQLFANDIKKRVCFLLKFPCEYRAKVALAPIGYPHRKPINPAYKI